MSELWQSYTTLKLNGIIFSSQELKILSDEKLINPITPQWEKSIFSFLSEWLNDCSEIVVNTSGSTGKPKSISIGKNRMIESARATNAFFKLNENHKALLCLPTEYIAGKMMLVRAFVGGFDLHYLEPSSDILFSIKEPFDFIAVVPLQLNEILETDKIHLLNQIKKMIVGGAALRQSLIQKFENLETEVWATYGMTETITHIALQRLNGKNKADCFQALPNVQFSIDERGCLRIFAPNINYEEIQTNDKVNLLNHQQFKLFGRIDFVINSGGIKFSPEILEQKLEPFVKNNFAFSSKQDNVLGEKLVLIIEGEEHSNEERNKLDFVLKKFLDRFEQPKEVIFINELPKTSNSKLDRLRLKEIIASIK